MGIKALFVDTLTNKAGKFDPVKVTAFASFIVAAIYALASLLGKVPFFKGTIIELQEVNTDIVLYFLTLCATCLNLPLFFKPKVSNGNNGEGQQTS